MKPLALAILCTLLAACGKQESDSTPLPTRDKTIGRVEEGLKKAEEEAAKRRQGIDNAAK